MKPLHRTGKSAVHSVILLITLTGCSDSSPATHDVPGPTSRPAAPESAAASPDGDVLNAVFADLLERTDSPLAMRHQPPAQIRFVPRPATYPRTVDHVLLRRDEKAWAALSSEQSEAARAAAADLVRRHKAGEPFGPFEPGDPRVKIEPDPPTTAPTTRRARWDRPVVAYLPGYTPDGQFAAVSLILPWSMHHADATYLLAREGDGWRVVLRQFIYYF